MNLTEIKLLRKRSGKRYSENYGFSFLFLLSDILHNENENMIADKKTTILKSNTPSKKCVSASKIVQVKRRKRDE